MGQRTRARMPGHFARAAWHGGATALYGMAMATCRLCHWLRTPPFEQARSGDALRSAAQRRTARGEALQALRMA